MAKTAQIAEILNRCHTQCVALNESKESLLSQCESLKKSIEAKKPSEFGPSFQDVISAITLNKNFETYAQYRKNIAVFLTPPLQGHEAVFLWGCAHPKNKGESEHSPFVLLKKILEQERRLIEALVGCVNGVQHSPANIPYIQFIKNKAEEMMRKNKRQMLLLEEYDFRAIRLSDEEDTRIAAPSANDNASMSRRFFLRKMAAGLLAAAFLDASEFVKKASGQTTLEVRGINYDIGTQYTPSFMSRHERTCTLTAEDIYRELTLIRDHLHCNAVRIYGGDNSLLKIATECALELGMEAWVSPRYIDATMQETIRMVFGVSQWLEALRIRYPQYEGKIVLILGNELTLDCKGFLKGETYNERRMWLFKEVGHHFLSSLIPKKDEKLNSFLKVCLSQIRFTYKGRVTYAAGGWEHIDWTPFEIIGVNYYKTSLTTDYKRGLEEWVKSGKKVVMMEFGCASYDGAQKQGGASYDIVQWNMDKFSVVKGKQKRNEMVQAAYIEELLALYKNIGVYGAFPFTFVEPQYVHHPDNPQLDLDMASLGIMKVYPNGNNQPTKRMEPKQAFLAISRVYSS